MLQETRISTDNCWPKYSANSFMNLAGASHFPLLLILKWWGKNGLCKTWAYVPHKTWGYCLELEQQFSARFLNIWFSRKWKLLSVLFTKERSLQTWMFETDSNLIISVDVNKNALISRLKLLSSLKKHAGLIKNSIFYKPENVGSEVEFLRSIWTN